jgi:hypothetical protein
MTDTIVAAIPGTAGTPAAVIPSNGKGTSGVQADASAAFNGLPVEGTGVLANAIANPIFVAI